MTQTVPYGHILAHRRVAVGGAVTSTKRVVFLMHETFDRPTCNLHDWGKFYLTKEPGEYVARGSIDNPAFSWPMYAVVSQKDKNNGQS